MKEIIRFAWGISSLGDFLVAISDRGIVAVEFSSDHAAMEGALQARFPDAVPEHSQDGLEEVVATVARVIDDPTTACDLPLDLRGTPYEAQVWQMLREIPPGETTSYGVLASKFGTRDPRDVTQAIANNAIAVIVPCHRVIKKDGSISGYRWGVRRKRALLSRERRSQTQ
ncbi:methylated-DNA--[protein]-cysteine S-methyltransferase [Bosea sp. NPDC055332]